MSASESRYRSAVEARAKHGLDRHLTDVERLAGGRIQVDGRSFVDLSSNDYLGLSRHPDLIARAAAWAVRFGTGAGASRLVTGNGPGFAAIESKIARLKGKEAALVLASGFQTNAAVLAALLDRRVLEAEPLVFADRLNHASLHFGCAAAGVTQIRYRHADAAHLADVLDAHGEDQSPKFIVTESVFSMDGDVAPMAALKELARAHGAMLIVDDAHATGVLGAAGRGLAEGADVILGTFSKALGAFGGFVACSAALRDYLINACSGLIYSTALPPPALGAIDAALDLLPTLDAERHHLVHLATSLRSGAQALGLDVGSSSTQIVPLIVGEAEAALRLSRQLKQAGFWVAAIRPPTVPRGSARLRVALSSAHGDDDVVRLLAALERSRETCAHPLAGQPARTSVHAGRA